MTVRVASLAMYDSAALHAANDSLWSAIGHHLRANDVAHVPDRLERTRPLDEIWNDPNLLLGQICGYPLVTRWHGKLRYVATPCYRAPGCEGTAHRSRIVVRIDDPSETLRSYRGRTAAVNDLDSNTGMNLMRAVVAPFATNGSFFGGVNITGSHAASAWHVANGHADIATIDNVTFAHLEVKQPDLVRKLRTLGWTAATPGLPFVTSTRSSGQLVRRLRRAIDHAIKDQAAAANALLLNGIEAIGLRRYRVVKTLERRSIDGGYAQLG